MNWFAHYAFDSRAAERVALAVVVLPALALCIGIVKFVSSLLSNKRDEAKSEKNYWHIHGGE